MADQTFHWRRTSVTRTTPMSASMSPCPRSGRLRIERRTIAPQQPEVLRQYPQAVTIIPIIWAVVSAIIANVFCCHYASELLYRLPGCCRDSHGRADFLARSRWASIASKAVHPQLSPHGLEFRVRSKGNQRYHSWKASLPAITSWPAALCPTKSGEAASPAQSGAEALFPPKRTTLLTYSRLSTN